MTRRPQSTCALYTSAHYNRDNTVRNSPNAVPNIFGDIALASISYFQPMADSVVSTRGSFQFHRLTNSACIRYFQSIWFSEDLSSCRLAW